jgi:dTDP-glucose pyrophosphorylase
MKESIQNICVSPEISILECFKKMDMLAVRLLLVTEDDLFLSVVSIGDLQRAILNDYNLDTQIKNILRVEVEFANTSSNLEEIKQHMLATRTECMPVVNNDKRITDVIFWNDLFEESIDKKLEIQLPVVIMAGGSGSRLKPLTNVIPKALIPIGDNTILEEIIFKFQKAGCNTFYLSLNYMADMILQYLDKKDLGDVSIIPVYEHKPLGTAGSLYLLKGKITSTFIISNCDIIINQDTADIYNYHKNNNNDITIVAALKHYKIPYGILESGPEGNFISMTEKPEITYKIITGVYIAEAHILNLIPENTFIHITDLITMLGEKGYRVGVFPISEGAYKDIGEWHEYYKTLQYFNK